MDKKRLNWLDFLKGFAILAVILDHFYNVLYKNQLIQYHTSFSVALFIFLAGVTSAMSLSHGDTFKFYQKRFKSIVFPYFVATLITCLLLKKPFLHSFFYFNAAGPYYFLFFFIQLILIAPLLNRLSPIFILLIFPLSFYLNRDSLSISSLWGGGGHLFGGSFLFLFFIGILFYRYLHLFPPKKNLSFLFLLGLIIFEYFHLIPYTWHNPPYYNTMVYTMLIFGTFYNLNLKTENILVRLFSFIGRYSLYIFLYHSLLVSFFDKF